jgi:hypothetical protein
VEEGLDISGLETAAAGRTMILSGNLSFAKSSLDG